MNKLLIIASFLILLSCQKKTGDWQGGEDQNNNGIRDNIDTWIASKSNGKPRLRMALETLAKVNPADCEYSIKARCLEQLSDDGILLQVELLELQLNTADLRKSFEDNVKHCPRIDDRKINYKCIL